MNLVTRSPMFCSSTVDHSNVVLFCSFCISVDVNATESRLTGHKDTKGGFALGTQLSGRQRTI